MHESDDATPRLGDELGELYADTDPPPDLEDRVVAAVIGEGSSTPAPVRTVDGGYGAADQPPLLQDVRQVLARAAAVILLFGGGWLAGSLAGSGSGAAAAPTHLLLLWESPEFAAGHPPGSLAAEYSAWAEEMGVGEVIVGGAELSPARDVVGGEPGSTVASGAPTEPFIGGYFALSVQDPEAAVALANGHPHVRYGGWIEVAEVMSR